MIKRSGGTERDRVFSSWSRIEAEGSTGAQTPAEALAYTYLSKPDKAVVDRREQRVRVHLEARRKTE
jgi:hypothetical protein